jgi:hypothetical protein
VPATGSSQILSLSAMYRIYLQGAWKIHVPPHLLASIFQVKLTRMILTPSRSEKP